MERSSFEIFKSNIRHSVKDLGDLEFIKRVLISDEITKLYEKKWYPECLYLLAMLAMLDYVSRKNNIPICTNYNKLRCGKLEEIVYPAGIYIMYRLTGDENILKESYENAIPEFKRFNIVENNVEDVA